MRLECGRVRAVHRGFAIGLVLLVVVGTLIRVSVRDHIPGLDLLYYLLPFSVLGLLCLVAAALWLRHGSRLPAVACGVVGASLLVGGLAGHHVGSACAEPEGDLKIVLWNVARAKGGWTRLGQELRRTDADVIGLIEAGPPGERSAAFWKSTFPDYQVAQPGSGLVVLARGEVRDNGLLRFAPKSWMSFFDVSVRGRSFRVLLVDAQPIPPFNREPVMRGIVDAAQTDSDLPLVVMGDFNTPHDSVWLRPLRASMTNVFEVAGHGWLPTWPALLPFVAIDQVWVDGGFEARCSHQDFSWLSDHRRIRATLTFAR